MFAWTVKARAKAAMFTWSVEVRVKGVAWRVEVRAKRAVGVNWAQGLSICHLWDCRFDWNDDGVWKLIAAAEITKTVVTVTSSLFRPCHQSCYSFAVLAPTHIERLTPCLSTLVSIQNNVWPIVSCAPRYSHTSFSSINSNRDNSSQLRYPTWRSQQLQILHTVVPSCSLPASLSSNLHVNPTFLSIDYLQWHLSSNNLFLILNTLISHSTVWSVDSV